MGAGEAPVPTHGELLDAIHRSRGHQRSATSSDGPAIKVSHSRPTRAADDMPDHQHSQHAGQQHMGPQR